jgi:hypothetical protein
MRYLLFLILMVLVSVNSVQAAERLYMEADVMYSKVKVSSPAVDGSFTIYNPKFKLGYYLRKQVALELLYTASGDDDDGGAKLKIDQGYGAFLRLESNLHNRARIYLLGGYSRTELSVENETINDNKYDGFSWGIGAEDQVVRMKNTFFTLEYMRYYKNDGVDFSGISLGLRFLF